MTSYNGTPDIMTASGRFISFIDPQPEQIDLDDIAHGLAHTCRFAGQCLPYYSVAEHSINVAMLVPGEYRLLALFHDAAEAYMTDLPRPLKRLLPEYKVIEDRLLAAILRRFGLSSSIPDCVKDADGIMLATEGRDLCAPGWEFWGLQHAPLMDRLRREDLVTATEAKALWLGFATDWLGEQ